MAMVTAIKTGTPVISVNWPGETLVWGGHSESAIDDLTMNLRDRVKTLRAREETVAPAAEVEVNPKDPRVQVIKDGKTWRGSATQKTYKTKSAATLAEATYYAVKDWHANADS